MTNETTSHIRLQIFTLNTKRELTIINHRIPSGIHLVCISFEPPYLIPLTPHPGFKPAFFPSLTFTLKLPHFALISSSLCGWWTGSWGLWVRDPLPFWHVNTPALFLPLTCCFHLASDTFYKPCEKWSKAGGPGQAGERVQGSRWWNSLPENPGISYLLQACKAAFSVPREWHSSTTRKWSLRSSAVTISAINLAKIQILPSVRPLSSSHLLCRKGFSLSLSVHGGRVLQNRVQQNQKNGGKEEFGAQMTFKLDQQNADMRKDWHPLPHESR